MPRKRPKIVVAVTAAVFAAACRREATPAAEPAPVPRAPEASRPTYRAPADGRVTKAQVEAYLGVLEKVKLDRSRKPSGSILVPGDPLNMESSDVAAARERGWNVAEYLWVRERVLEAEAVGLGDRLMASHLAMLERTLAELRTRRASAPDEGSRKLLGEQIANFETEANRTRRESRERDPENVRANLKTIEPLLARLEAAGDVLDQPLPRGAAPVRSPTPAPSR